MKVIIYITDTTIQIVISILSKKSQTNDEILFPSVLSLPCSIYCRLNSRQIRTSSPRRTYRPNFIVSRVQAVESSTAISTYYPLDSRCSINSIYINLRYLQVSRDRSVSWERNSRSQFKPFSLSSRDESAERKIGNNSVLLAMVGWAVARILGSALPH